MKKTAINLINSILKKDSSILAAYLFGSQIKGSPNKYSDIDIGILLGREVNIEKYTDIQIAVMNDISQKLNKEADVVILNRTSMFLKYYILKNGIRIYEKPDRAEHLFEARAIVEYFDFLPVKTMIENAILKRVKEA
ncbi:MAG: nucleotidyltransferase domain-containing protein [Candidatus Omnitrophota bacterium]